MTAALLRSQLVELAHWRTAAVAVATHRPGDGFADLLGENHWITQTVRCDHPADYDPDTEPEGAPLPECAGSHAAILVAREQVARIDRIAGRLAKRLEETES